MRGLAVVLVLAGCSQVLGFQHLNDNPKPDAPPPPSSWATMTGTLHHSCGLHLDGTLWCWGRNDHRALGVDQTMTPEADAPVQVGSDTWLVVSTRGDHTCALKSDHSLWCWGHNDGGQLDTGDILDTNHLVQVPGTWNTTATGGDMSCGLATDGSLSCWGYDDKGQFGDGTGHTGSPYTVQRVDTPGLTWKSLVAGDQFACGLTDTGTAYCWGENSWGQTGADSAQNPVLPTAVAGGNTFVKLAAGYRFACGLDGGGRILCWGNNAYGQLGDDTQNDSYMPKVAGGISDFVDVAVGDWHACGVRRDGSLWCWGNNEHDQLGADVGPLRRTGRPIQVMSGPGGWIAVGAGAEHTCAIEQSQHQLWCMGLGGGGQLGTTGAHLAPVQVAGAWTSVAAGEHVTCALDGGGVASCWGYNGDGTVGTGDQLDVQSPALVAASGTTWSSITVGDHACARDGTGIVKCWGYNGVGAIGDNTQNSHPTPTANTSGLQFGGVSASIHTCATTNAGQVYCWGHNDNGECGVPPTTLNPVLTPTSIASSYAQVASGRGHTCGAAASPGTGVKCWGYSALGELGDNDTQMDHYSPVVVMNLPAMTFTQVTSGDYHSCAIAGTRAWCWGDNENGEIGDMNVGVEPVAVEVTTPAASWSAISAGGHHTCAIDTSGRLYCFGGNDSGQLGLGDLMDVHEPTQVGSDSDWAAVSTGSDHTCAIKKVTNALFCWGGNGSGQIGDSTAWRTDLQQVP